MANYTVTLRTIVENGVNIFDFNYPFYNEEKRKEFEEKFIKHFYFHEIGCETVERFKWYLEDKMNTVFPYYNELFKSASIEYDVLDNYKLTEIYTRDITSNNKQAGVSSSVGQIFSNETATTENTQTVNNTADTDTTGTDTEKETSISTGKSTTVNDETINGTLEKESTTEESGENEIIKRFLDTPQGLLDLSNESRYITNINHDKEQNSKDTVINSTDTENKTTDGTSTTDTSGNGERNVTKSTELNTATTAKETTDGETSTTSNGEQKTTEDNNVRNYSNGEQKETYTLTRRGNIGVDTDSDAIEKHNRLQKTLKNIELMFFDECNDLFMLVY